MERGGDLEFGEVELIQDTIQGLSSFVENEDNHTNRFSSSIHRKPEETTFTTERGGDLEFGEVDSIQNGVENEENHTNRFSPSIHRRKPEETTFTMERGDLEFGEVELIQGLLIRWWMCIARFVTYLEIMSSTMVGDTNMIQDSVVQRLLCHVKKEKEESHINQFSPSNYMAPRTLRDMSPSSFNPQVVSIGPLHKEDEKVQAFEVRKTSYLIDLMRRAKSPPEEILKLCVEKVYTSLEKIKACYLWTKACGDTEIAYMMIMDACFILEFLFRYWIYDAKVYEEGVLQHSVIFYDLVLLENQIPFFILDEIFQCTVLKFRPNASLLELIYPVLDFANIFKERININAISVNNTHHILSLLHQCYKPPDNIKKGSLKSTIPSVMNLDRAGVNFKPNNDPTWLMGMKVELYMFPCFFGSLSKPTLRIPVLEIYDSTEIVLRNLIAYEQSGQTHTYVTSYAYAMDTLVDTQEDVVKLVDSGVLVNALGSNAEAANMINGICKGPILPDFFYEEQWVKLNKYCDAYWPKNIANMKRTYFSSPWNMIALVAGIILFAVTVVQTIFTIKST
ncbi:UPF0481 protein At3g47200 isoform X3 [Helianthus annuus]|uniref:UPF0481 protein At3g47200 isoform X3 n=1 Tax=Helianthus annuus TaxID=4232 RepID=UPI001652DC8E|nr:UPF0481 protein At3g47200 isoform X3 [Helianthus annuus]XP_035843972.1 UPF0481 protein At3g47200 isoform X3 [Helianthus annuus]